MSMLPVPFKTFIPKIYWQDGKSDVLATEADEHIEEWEQDVYRLEWLHDPARCPSTLLGELGAWLNVGLLNTDSDATRRQKIATAIQGHKRRGSFNMDVKQKVDLIAGGNSFIISNSPDIADWVMSDGTTYPESYYWASMGTDGVDGFLGLDLAAGIGELNQAGVVAIDIDNAAPTAGQIDALVETLRDDVVPGYYRVLLGHDAGSGFVVYSVIE